MALSARFGLRAIFAVQIGLAVALLGRDFAAVAPDLLRLGGTAPAFDQPVHPGDQTRRFAPAPSLLRPGRSVPGLDTSDQSSRLLFEAEAPGRIRLSGAIAEGDAARFAEWLEANFGAGSAMPPPRVAALHSSGGSVSDALELGAALRAAELDTEVGPDDICLSACPYMLVGGVARRVWATAKVGVHQHYYGETGYLPAFLAVEDIQRSQARVLVHLAQMGVDPQVMATAMATPPEDIYILVPEELTAWRVATDVIE